MIIVQTKVARLDIIFSFTWTQGGVQGQNKACPDSFYFILGFPGFSPKSPMSQESPQFLANRDG